MSEWRTITVELKDISSIGSKALQRLKRLGVGNLGELLHFYPRRYLDLSRPQKINELILGNIGSVKAKVETIQSQRTPRKRMVVTKAELVDETGRMGAVWFNQPFLEKVLRLGIEFIFVGRVERDFLRGGLQFVGPDYEKRAQIVPIYPETEKLSSKQIRLILRNALPFASELHDALPETLRKKENLLSLKDSLIKIHLPQSQKDIAQARKRLGLEELLTIILSRLILKQSLAKLQAVPIKIEPEILRDFVEELPFKLTDDQRRAAWQILQDMSKEEPMNRLLEGDVGSGKTVVAFLAGLMAIHRGLQVAWMNPTDILARQHYETAQKLIKPFGIRVALWTASAKMSKFKIFREYQLIIGTHALIQKDVNFRNLGLVIVDEQHRFGVEQRMALSEKGKGGREKGDVPHFLSITATPIPRTLALSIYGDLEISRLKIKPAGRPEIKTVVFQPEEREKSYKIIKEEIVKGKQGFVICPLITGEEKVNLFEDDRKSVETEFKNLVNTFPDFRIGKLHGRMKGQEKERVMADFRDEKIDLLVSTTVVEVGIDIPNATVILIEGGERLGLAQLHQLRGRVGRGLDQSFCLVTAGAWSETTEKRLKAFAEFNDGFLLAEKDLEIRGPGKLLGEIQSGRMELGLARLSDRILVEKAKELAGEVLSVGEGKAPLLFAKARQLIETEHLE